MSAARTSARSPVTFRRWLFALLLAACGTALAQTPSPHAIDIPRWFATTFLDFREDVGEAAHEGKRLLVYFGQDGCPYCTKLMTVNFSQQAIVDKTRRHFVATAINIFGDREVTWTDGKTMSEKELTALLKVRWTPTLVFFDEKGAIALQVSGYQSPEEFNRVLDPFALDNARGLKDQVLAGDKPKVRASGQRMVVRWGRWRIKIHNIRDDHGSDAQPRSKLEGLDRVNYHVAYGRQVWREGRGKIITHAVIHEALALPVEVMVMRDDRVACFRNEFGER